MLGRLIFFSFPLLLVADVFLWFFPLQFEHEIVSEAVALRALEFEAAHPEFTPEAMGHISRPALALCQWVQAMTQYGSSLLLLLLLQLSLLLLLSFLMLFLCWRPFSCTICSGMWQSWRPSDPSARRWWSCRSSRLPRNNVLELITPLYECHCVIRRPRQF